MARVTIHIRQYHFTPPKSFTEAEFIYFKQMLKSNPKAKLNEGLKENPFIKGLKIAGLALLSPLMLVSSALLEQELKSSINKWQAKKTENNFYDTLKILVLKSSDFEEFDKNLKETFSFYK